MSGDRIEELLSTYRPSQLDAEVTKVCPLYREPDGRVSSVYLSLHELARSALLSRLALGLRGLRVRGEEDCGDGRTDGSVSTPSLDGNFVLGPSGEKLVLIEVKTGLVKLLQAASYSYMEGVPILVAELETGDVHLLNPETSERLLSFAADQLCVFAELEKEGVRIPDKPRCVRCSNADCPYRQEGREYNGSPSIPEKARELEENLPGLVEKCIGKIKRLLAERGYRVLGKVAVPNLPGKGETAL